jgi:hypothetical protein
LSKCGKTEGTYLSRNETKERENLEDGRMFEHNIKWIIKGKKSARIWIRFACFRTRSNGRLL